MIEKVFLGSVAILMLAAVSRKLRVTDEFRAAVASWRLGPAGSSRVIARLIVAVEVATGQAALMALLLVPGAGPWVLLVACAVLFAFAGVQAAIAVRTDDADCGCFGHRTHINAWSAGRTAGLASLLLAGLARSLR